MTHTDRARYALSDWHFWVIVAYLGLVGVVVALYFVNDKTSKASVALARQTAVRQAAVIADRKAATAARKLKVTQCMDSRKPGSNLRRINGFLHGVQVFHEIIATNNRAIVESTPTSDPTYQVRLNNYRRILRTVKDVSGVSFPIPSVADCKRLGK